jgi:uncharacterized protein YegL
MGKKKVTTTVTTTVTEEIISSNEKTQIICILDRSGSMSENGVIYEAINGFNNFLKDQRKLKDNATITVTLFDDRFEMLYDDVPVNNVKDITYDTWTPRGMTALYDAIGKTVNTVRAHHKTLGVEKPAKVLVCIVTDGKNNASHEYTKDGIRSLIQQCEGENWNFVYLAANQSAFEVGTSFGVSGGNTYSFAATGAGANAMSGVMNMVSTSYRSMSTSDQHFKSRSKSLIDNQEDEKNPQDFSNGTITTDGTNVCYTSNNANTVVDLKDQK